MFHHVPEKALKAGRRGEWVACEHPVELSADLRRFLGYPADLRGVVVTDVAPGSPAAEAGIRRGDVITRGGEGEVLDIEELNAALASARGTIPLLGVRQAEAGKPPKAWAVALAVPEPTGR